MIQDDDTVTPSRAVALLATRGLTITVAELDATRFVGRITRVGKRYALAELGRFVIAERERRDAELCFALGAAHKIDAPIAFKNLRTRMVP